MRKRNCDEVKASSPVTSSRNALKKEKRQCDEVSQILAKASRDKSGLEQRQKFCAGVTMSLVVLEIAGAEYELHQKLHQCFEAYSYRIEAGTDEKARVVFNLKFKDCPSYGRRFSELIKKIFAPEGVERVRAQLDWEKYERLEALPITPAIVIEAEKKHQKALLPKLKVACPQDRDDFGVVLSFANSLARKLNRPCTSSEIKAAWGKDKLLSAWADLDRWTRALRSIEKYVAGSFKPDPNRCPAPRT
jgi:hypothetical protein